MGTALAPVMRVGLATPSDAREILGIMRLAWAAHKDIELGITADDIEYEWQRRLTCWNIHGLEEAILLSLRSRVDIVAKQGERVIGVCGLKCGGEENILQALYVHPAQQGQGIARLLWQEAQKFLDARVATVLWVASFNFRAQWVYRRWGFEITGETKPMPLRNGKEIPIIQMKRASGSASK